MKQSGFSLVSTMVAIAIGSIAVVISLTIIKSINSTIGYANASSEIVNQLYEARVALTDPATCAANLAGVNLATGTIALAQVLRPLASTGSLNMSARILPDSATAPGLRAYAISQKIFPSPTTPNLAKIQFEFQSPNIAVGSVLRDFPLYVTTDAGGLITACTAGAPGGGGGGGGGGGPTPTPYPSPTPDPGGRTRSTGNCDNTTTTGPTSTLSAGFGPATPFAPSAAARRTFQDQVCNTATYPVPSTGASFPCGGSNLRAPDEEFFVRSKCSRDEETGRYSGSITFPKFAGVASREECLALPLFEEGITFLGPERRGAGDSLIRDTYTCIAGNWYRTGRPSTVSIDTPNE